MSASLTLFPLAFAEEGDEELFEKLRRELEAINLHLRSCRRDEHREPESIPKEAPSRNLFTSIAYSDLHRFCWFAARVRYYGDDWTPTPIRSNDDIELSKKAVFELSTMLRCHIILPMLSDVYFLPIDFGEVLYVEKLPNSEVGSSFALLRELEEVAIPLGLSISNGSVATVKRAAPPDLSDEREVWSTLYSYARHSIEFKTVLTVT